MKKVIIPLLFAGLILFIFKPFFFQNKILFPSNLLVSSFAPWKYEPFPEYPSGPPNKPMGFDNIRQFFPNRYILRQELLNGRIPLWNPYIYGGTPFMAAFDTAVFYPLSWIAVLLPAVDGWNFLVLVQPLLSLIFMYLFLRSMKFEVATSVFGALAYALSGWMIVYWQEILVLEHSFLWLPLALYASNRLWDRSHDKLGFILLILALSCSVFGGFLQMSIYVYGCVLLWNIFCFARTIKQKSGRASAVRVGSAIIVSLLLSSIQIIPSIEAFLLSPRGTDSSSSVFRNNLLPVQNLVTLVAPDYWGSPATYNYFGGNGFYFEKMIFIGIIPLLFALYGLFSVKNRTSLFWICMGIIALSLGFALPSSWLPYSLKIPVLSNSYPTRIFAVWVISAVTVASFGLEAFIKHQNWIKMVVILLGISLLLGIAWVPVTNVWCVTHGNPQNFLCRINLSGILSKLNMTAIQKEASSYATVSLRNLVIPTLFIFSAWCLLLLFKLSKKIGLCFVIGLTLVSGMYFAQKYVYFGERKFVYPDLSVINKLSELAGYNRVWGYGNAFIEKNLPQYYRWFSTDGYGNLSPTRYAELLSTIVHKGKLGGTIRRSDSDIYEASEWDPFGTANSFRLRIMSLLGVKYILESKKGELKDKISTERRFPAALFDLDWEDGTWRIWKFKNALPRVMFLTDYIIKTGNQQIIDSIYDPQFRLDQTVILESQPIMNTTSVMTQNNFSPHAEIQTYGMSEVKVTTNSNRDGFLMLTDNYYPGWQATVDGVKTRIYRADYTFKAVFVPKGKHIVTFTYLPQTFILGVILAGIGGCIVLFFLVFHFKVQDKIGNSTKKRQNTNNKSRLK
jgi:hypothetical protein